MKQIRITWNEKFLVTVQFDDKSNNKIGKMQLIRQEIINYLAGIRKSLFFGLVLLFFSGIIMLVSEPNSDWYMVALQVAFVIVGVHIVCRVIINLFGIIFCVYFESRKSWEISEKGIAYLVNGKEKKTLYLADIKSILIKEIYYKDFSVCELQIKDKNRNQHTVKFPIELKTRVYNALHSLNVPAAISGKPHRG